LVALVEAAGGESHKKRAGRAFWSGDMSQPRGGPMFTGHASHQVGLYADIRTRCRTTELARKTIARKCRLS